MYGCTKRRGWETYRVKDLKSSRTIAECPTEADAKFIVNALNTSRAKIITAEPVAPAVKGQENGSPQAPTS